MRATLIKNRRRERRKHHVRAAIRRTTTLPRLSVFRSSKHVSAQVIDDHGPTGSRTLCAATSTAKGLAAELAGKTKSQRAAVVGTEIAKKAVALGVTEVVFDRGSSRYHGRVKALAEAARAAGLKF
jgi:large subunit ribosomal protein L18